MHMYMTAAQKKTDMKGIGLQVSPLLTFAHFYSRLELLGLYAIFFLEWHKCLTLKGYRRLNRWYIYVSLTCYLNV
jgi:hypothetical protein